MDILKNSCVSIVSAMVLNGFARLIRSEFLPKFLSDNLITLLIALLAINITTLSVMMTKVSELNKEKDSDFSRTISQMKLSILEQCALIVIALLLLITAGSATLVASIPHCSFLLSTSLLALLVYAVLILYDTANSVFILLNNKK